jgi:hypothetical protein
LSPGNGPAAIAPGAGFAELKINPKPLRRRGNRGAALEEYLPAPKPKERVMRACEVCGNEYDQAFTVKLDGQTHTFDCFECAIHALAPTCTHCGCKIIGHGVQHEDDIFCCAHCAKSVGVVGVADRA